MDVVRSIYRQLAVARDHDVGDQRVLDRDRLFALAGEHGIYQAMRCADAIEHVGAAQRVEAHASLRAGREAVVDERLGQGLVAPRIETRLADVAHTVPDQVRVALLVAADGHQVDPGARSLVHQHVVDQRVAIAVEPGVVDAAPVRLGPGNVELPTPVETGVETVGRFSAVRQAPRLVQVAIRAIAAPGDGEVHDIDAVVLVEVGLGVPRGVAGPFGTSKGGLDHRQVGAVDGTVVGDLADVGAHAPVAGEQQQETGNSDSEGSGHESSTFAHASSWAGR